MWEKANVKGAVPTLGREYGRYTSYAQDKRSSVSLSWLYTKAVGLNWAVPEAL